MLVFRVLVIIIPPPMFMIEAAFLPIIPIVSDIVTFALVAVIAIVIIIPLLVVLIVAAFFVIIPVVPLVLAFLLVVD
jgi:hypothetical protein